MAREVSPEQMNALLDFMSQHKNVAVETLGMKHTHPIFRELWNNVTSILNDCSTGSKKTPSEWRRFWTYFRSTIKNRLNLLKKAKNGGSMSVRPLNSFEKRALVIFGPHLVLKVKNSSAVHLYVNNNRQNLSAKLNPKKLRDSCNSNTTTINDCNNIVESDKDYENKHMVSVATDSDEDVDDINYTWYMS